MISGESPEDTHERYEKRPSWHLSDSIKDIGTQAVGAEVSLEVDETTEQTGDKAPELDK